MLSSILPQRRQIIHTYSSRESAGKALDHLVLAGFPIAQVFLLGHGCETDLPAATLPSSSYGTITGTATGLKRGMVWGNFVGGTTGLLVGAGLIALPGVGQLALAGAIAFVLLSGGMGTAAGGLIGALVGLELTAEQAKNYSQQVSQGSVLLLVEGTASELEWARHLLQTSYS